MNAGRLLARLAAVVVRHPLVAGAVIAVVLLRVLLGPARLLDLILFVAAVLVAWWRLHPSSFTRRLSSPVRSCWRGWAVYRRRWEPVMTTIGLTTTYGDAVFVPRLRRIVCGRCVDSLLV